MKSWKGVTQEKHLKLSDSQEFQLKTWNSCHENKNWISTKLGKSQIPLDTGIIRETARFKNSKYNDKTLLLQKEKERYEELETEFKKLLLQVEKLQANHALELAKVKKELKTSQNSLGHALDLKSQEMVGVTRELQVWQGKYAAESEKWIFTNQDLIEKLQKLEKENLKLVEKIEIKDQNLEILKEKVRVEFKIKRNRG
jgi:predicted  nucleic acid-binding Zn-ribbon protein